MNACAVPPTTFDCPTTVPAPFTDHPIPLFPPRSPSPTIVPVPIVYRNGKVAPPDVVDPPTTKPLLLIPVASLSPPPSVGTGVFVPFDTLYTNPCHSPL